MAWMIEKPHSFGALFPESEYIGWEEAVPDIEVQVAEVSNKFGGGGDFVKEHFQPRKARLLKNYKRLGDIFMLNYGLLTVQQPLKDLLEEMEPGVHQFWPVEVFLKDGQPFDMSCYGMVVGRKIATLDVERSDAIRKPSTLIELNRDYGNKKKPFDATISKEARNSVHLWHEPLLLEIDYMISDELRDAIKARRMRFFKMYHANEV